MSSILGPNGTPMVELGGDRAWRQRVIGDIVCSFQWIDLSEWGESGDGPEPCMVLFASSRRIDAGAYTIPQRNAYMYADGTGRPTEWLFRAAWAAAETLGFSRADKSAYTRILDVIVEAIPDLLAMPSEQPAALEVRKPLLGIEISATAAGKQLHAEVI